MGASWLETSGTPDSCQLLVYKGSALSSKGKQKCYFLLELSIAAIRQSKAAWRVALFESILQNGVPYLLVLLDDFLLEPASGPSGDLRTTAQRFQVGVL